jgi:hypothetical protein
MTDAELNQAAATHLPGHRQPRLPNCLRRWATGAARDVAHDVYGSGALIQDFEQKVARLLGFDAAVFCITGTMTQATALRIACMERGSKLVALHPTSHILKHERGNHQLFDHFHALQIGDRIVRGRWGSCRAYPTSWAPSRWNCRRAKSAASARSWDELPPSRTTAANRASTCTWTARACGRLRRRMAAGQRDCSGLRQRLRLAVQRHRRHGRRHAGRQRGFVAKAQEWFRRQGGNVYQRTPYVVAAAMQFDARLAAMPDYFKRTQWLYDVLRDYPLLTPNPARPQANMLHHLPVSRERALEIRNRIAGEHSVWLFNGAIMRRCRSAAPLNSTSATTCLPAGPARTRDSDLGRSLAALAHRALHCAPFYLHTTMTFHALGLIDPLLRTLDTLGYRSLRRSRSKPFPPCWQAAT